MTLLTFFECCYFVVSGMKIKTTGLNVVVAEGRHFNSIKCTPFHWITLHRHIPLIRLKHSH